MAQRIEDEKIRKRIGELVDRALKHGDDRGIVDSCFMGTLGLTTILYGPNSPQEKALRDTRSTLLRDKRLGTVTALAHSMAGALLNMREELEAGLTRRIATEAAGVVIGDLVALAKEAMRDGRLQVAAVLAAAALEDALKRKAEDSGLKVEGKSMDAVVNALKTQAVFKGAQVPIVSSFVKLRNAALHAEWSKVGEADVSSLIGFLEPFVAEHFA